MDTDSDRLVCDYYVISVLGVEDDLECSKGRWLREELAQKSTSEEHGVVVIRDGAKAEVLAWAERSFAKRPECCVAIVELRSKRKFRVPHLVYLSPPVYQRIEVPVANDIGQQVAYYRDALNRLAAEDRWQELLRRRKEERERNEPRAEPELR